VPSQLGSRLAKKPGDADPRSANKELAQSVYNAVHCSVLWQKLLEADSQLVADGCQRATARKSLSHFGVIPIRFKREDSNKWGLARDPGNWIYAVSLEVLELYVKYTPPAGGGNSMTTRTPPAGGGAGELKHYRTSLNEKKRTEKGGDIIETFLGAFLTSRAPPGTAIDYTARWNLSLRADIPEEAAITRYIDFFMKLEDVTHIHWSRLQAMSPEVAAKCIYEMTVEHYDEVAWWWGSDESNTRRRSKAGWERHKSRDAARAAARKVKGKGKRGDTPPASGGKPSAKGSGATSSGGGRGDTPPASGGKPSAKGSGAASSGSWTWAATHATSPVSDGGKGASSGGASHDWATRGEGKGSGASSSGPTIPADVLTDIARGAWRLAPPGSRQRVPAGAVEDAFGPRAPAPSPSRWADVESEADWD
jgi:hypothetical protein